MNNLHNKGAFSSNSGRLISCQALLFALSVGGSLLIVPSLSVAEGYVAIGGGNGGEADAPNLTFEAGGITSGKTVNLQAALGVSLLFNNDNVPDDTLEYPVPHWDYTTLGTRQKDTEVAIIGKLGLEVFKDSGVFVFGLGGASFANEIELAQSNVTGWYYQQSSNEEIYGIYGGGISFFPNSSKLMLQAEVDNRRGVTASIGVRW